MKNTIRGFVEGAFAITTGDRMKPGDHRRSKFRCKQFSDGYCCHYKRRCMGSSHCDDYNDGIHVIIREEVFDYRRSASYKNLVELLGELKYMIPLGTTEGEIIEEYFYQIYQLSVEDVKKARIQKKEHKKYLADVELLKNKIKKHNEKLLNKCLLISLGIITAPFCFLYYQSKKRNEDEEIKKIRVVVLDEDLQGRVEKLDREMEKCNSVCNRFARRSSSSEDHGIFEKAKFSFNKGEYSDAAFQARKAIMHKHTETMLWLAELRKCEISFLPQGDTHIFLWLYASYLGDRNASFLLAKAILRNDLNSEIGKALWQKSQKT